MGTIGVTRGFGDHDLRAIGSGLPIKPFLSPHPEVNYRDLTKVISIPEENNEDGDYGILIMATDGLWDVIDTETVSKTVFTTLSKYPTEKHRYTMVAQELVAKSRGRINESGHWRLADSKAAATVDDISVIVIPVYQYYKEYLEWERKCKEDLEKKKSMPSPASFETSVTTNGTVSGNEEEDERAEIAGDGYDADGETATTTTPCDTISSTTNDEEEGKATAEKEVTSTDPSSGT